MARLLAHKDYVWVRPGESDNVRGAVCAFVDVDDRVVMVARVMGRRCTRRGIMHVFGVLGTNAQFAAEFSDVRGTRGYTFSRVKTIPESNPAHGAVCQLMVHSTLSPLTSMWYRVDPPDAALAMERARACYDDQYDDVRRVLAARTITRRAKAVAASPFTTMGRRILLRRAGFEPDNHRLLTLACGPPLSLESNLTLVS